MYGRVAESSRAKDGTQISREEARGREREIVMRHSRMKEETSIGEKIWIMGDPKFQRQKLKIETACSAKTTVAHCQIQPCTVQYSLTQVPIP